MARSVPTCIWTATYVVKGQRVTRGEVIGRVGRTGVKRSYAHLHFELRDGLTKVDPLPHLGALVIAPGQTWRGRPRGLRAAQSAGSSMACCARSKGRKRAAIE